MNYIVFGKKQSTYSTVILVKESDLVKLHLDNYYVSKLNTESLIAIGLPYGGKTKPTNNIMSEFLDILMPKLNILEVKYLIAADSNYFKKLAGVTKVENYYNYLLPLHKNYKNNARVIYCPNYTHTFSNDTFESIIDKAITTVNSVYKGTYKEAGNVIKYAKYPINIKEIKQSLSELHQYPAITVDIETRGLKIDSAGLETIAFSWNDNSGIAFCVEKNTAVSTTITIKKLLKDFFSTYQGKCIYHGASFDIQILIYELWMKNIDDTKGMYGGLEVLTRNFEDTHLIAYLTTNNTYGNKLGLKSLSQEYCGNYAQEDIKDTTKINKSDLLQYNLTDTCATYWVYNKYYPKLVQERQEVLYRELFLPSQKVIIYMQLCGMPIDLNAVECAKKALNEHINECATKLFKKEDVQGFMYWNRLIVRDIANSKLKKKVKPISDFPLEFNPYSNSQVAALLHSYIGVKVIDTTPTKEPAVGHDNLNKLLPFVDSSTSEIIHLIQEMNTAQKILTTFIKAFEEYSIRHKDGYYLHGNFRLGGTVSGRISSNSPNLQNLPSGSTYGKLIKSCFVPASDKLFVSADYNALEAMIDALLTKDPNKMNVYLEGMDSHCFNAYTYWKDKMPDIRDDIEKAENATEFWIDDEGVYQCK